MVASRVIIILYPPVLKAGVVTLIGLFAFINISCRFQHLLRDLGVVMLPQIAHQGHPVHVHGIDEVVPRDIRVQFLIIGRQDNTHGLIEQPHIPTGRLIGIPGHGQPRVAHTADDVLSGSVVQLFVLCDVARAFHHIGMDTMAQQIDVVLGIADIDIVQGYAAVIQFLDDHGRVLAETGRFQQKFVDLICNADILAVGIVEHLARKVFQIRDVVIGQHDRVAGIDQLRQDRVVLPHHFIAAHGVALDRLQQHIRGRFRRELRFRERPDLAQVLDIAFSFLRIRHFHPDTLPSDNFFKFENVYTLL